MRRRVPRQANPNIKVKITQYGWDDYWTKLTNGFVAGTAPDVFTDHLSKYPEFVSQEQLLAARRRSSQGQRRRRPATSTGLADLWVGQDGKRYGLPKDWDTIALFYNKDDDRRAGVDPATAANLTWNPTDGGTYEKAIAHLTVDKNGKRGDEAGLRQDQRQGLRPRPRRRPAAATGQTQWSMYTGTTGWTVTDKNPWGTKYNYDDPKFQETIAWWQA